MWIRSFGTPGSCRASSGPGSSGRPSSTSEPHAPSALLDRRTGDDRPRRVSPSLRVPHRQSGRCYRARMRGDRVEVVVDTGQGVQTFDIVATKNGRRLEITTARGIVEVSEVTRGGTPVRTGRFMASRLIALVEHPAQEQPDSRVDVQTRRRLRPPTSG